jgi:hypothetical protein
MHGVSPIFGKNDQGPLIALTGTNRLQNSDMRKLKWRNGFRRSAERRKNSDMRKCNWYKDMTL